MTSELPLLSWTIRQLLVLALAALVVMGWSRFIRLCWALDFDRPRQLAFTVAPLQLVVVIAVWVSFVLPPWDVDPIAGGALAAVVTAVATAWGYGNLRDIAGGLTLAITRPFTVGDEIGTEAGSGRVIRLALTRVRIQTPAGALVDLPAARVSTAGLRVAGPPGQALPVAVTVPLPAGDRDEALWALRDHAYLSPYVDVAAPVVVELVDAAHARIQATPIGADDADELRSDLLSRASGSEA